MGEKKDNIAVIMWAEKTWERGQANVPPTILSHAHGPSLPPGRAMDHGATASESDLIFIYFFNFGWWESSLVCKNLQFFYACIKIHGYLDDTKVCESKQKD